jgi:hypothetical protein
MGSGYRGRDAAADLGDGPEIAVQEVLEHHALDARGGQLP